MKKFLLTLAMLSIAQAGLAAAIFEAAKEGNLALVQRIVSSSPDAINLKNSHDNDSTALHYCLYHDSIVRPTVALLNKRYEVAKYLLEKGANKNAVDRAGYTPLFLALYWTRFDIAHLLITHNAYVGTEERQAAEGAREEMYVNDADGRICIYDVSKQKTMILEIIREKEAAAEATAKETAEAAARSVLDVLADAALAREPA